MKNGLVELIFGHPQLTASSKLVALWVARYAYRNGEPLTRPSKSKMCKWLCIGRTTLDRALRNLAERKLMISAEVNGRRVFLFIGEWAG